MNLYTGRGLLLPASWRQVLGMPRGHHYGQLYVVAESKLEIPGMLADRGITPRESSWLVDGLRLHRPGQRQGLPVVMLLDSGVLDAEQPGIWATPSGWSGCFVIEVGSDFITRVARFSADPVSHQVAVERFIPADSKPEEGR